MMTQTGCSNRRDSQSTTLSRSSDITLSHSSDITQQRYHTASNVAQQRQLGRGSIGIGRGSIGIGQLGRGSIGIGHLCPVGLSQICGFRAA